MWGSDTSTGIDAFGPVPAEVISGDGMHQGMVDAGTLCTDGLAVGEGHHWAAQFLRQKWLTRRANTKSKLIRHGAHLLGKPPRPSGSPNE